MLRDPKPGASARRLALVAAVGALALGLSGFFMGLRQNLSDSSGRREAHVNGAVPISDSPEMSAGEHTGVPSALDYKRLPEHTLRANREWRNVIEKHDNLSPPVPVYVKPTQAQQESLRLQRASRRQFDGAPPVAPHPLNQRSSAACLECHGKPTFITGKAVPQLSHPVYANCLQCHASGPGPGTAFTSLPGNLSEGNQFQGRPPSGQGKRAFVGAPPVMPHATSMRTQCLECHGPFAVIALRTSHPERPNCLQCHATDAVADQRPQLAAIGVKE